MASYVDQVLISGEQVLYRGRVSLWPYAAKMVIGGAVLLGGLALLLGRSPMGWLWAGVGVAVLANVYLTYISTELAVTNKRIVAKFGFIRRSTVELNIGKVESVQVEQGVMGRLFDFGTIIVSGAGNPQAPVPGISRPIAFRQAFTQAVDAAR